MRVRLSVLACWCERTAAAYRHQIQVCHTVGSLRQCIFDSVSYKHRNSHRGGDKLTCPCRCGGRVDTVTGSVGVFFSLSLPLSLCCAPLRSRMRLPRPAALSVATCSSCCSDSYYLNDWVLLSDLNVARSVSGHALRRGLVTSLPCVHSDWWAFSSCHRFISISDCHCHCQFVVDLWMAECRRKS